MKKFIINVNGKSYDVEVEEVGLQGAPKIAPPAIQPAAAPAAQPVAPSAPVAPNLNASAAKDSNVITAPMPGKIVSIKVKTGQAVKEGDLLLTLEAMKMENEIYSSASGTVKEIRVAEGATVNPGEILIVI